LFTKYIKNPYLTVLAGSVLIVLLTLLVGNQDFNGAGGALIEQAMEGEALPYAFLLKILFTAITLGCGFKGGEIVPCFFIGSTFGCAVGPLLGLPASFSAGLGLLGVFCGCVNCPIASILLGVELFGGAHLAAYALICMVSFLLSGRYSLYATQKLAFSKCAPIASPESTK
jgi:H+/Cl- antiporter ClcA